MKILKGKVRRPRRVLLYGTHGIGKSSWASKAPRCVFLCCEDGLDDIGVDRTPLMKSFGEVQAFLSDLRTQDHDYRTLVIDTADWLERLIFAHVCEVAGKTSIEEVGGGYGKGYTKAAEVWDRLLSDLDQIRNIKGMAIILLAHAKVQRVNDPELDAYDRYEPDLHKSSCAMVQEWADEVLFARQKTIVAKEDAGFGKERARGIGIGERIVCTLESPSHLAKRRVQMPDVIPLDFAVYARHVMANQPAEESAGGDVSGIVRNGHSKDKVKE